MNSSTQTGELSPELVLLSRQAKEQDLKAMQEGLRGESASLLARYGANLAFANGNFAGAMG